MKQLNNDLESELVQGRELLCAGSFQHKMLVLSVSVSLCYLQISFSE